MTADSNFQINTNPDSQGDLLTHNTVAANQLMGAMDMLKRDRFELLSAYLDGEVTAAERRQVEDWLANDPESQRLYERLLKLRSSFQTIPAPAAQQPVEQTIELVYQRVHRRSRRRAVVWSGSAIAAVVLGAVSTVLPTRQLWQMAQSPHQEIEPLRVALNSPVVEIPKLGIASPREQSQPIESPQQQQNRDIN
ncbi:MAG TPA: Fis family transcriptional regulator [Cyanobacteria bacterium UBA11049]|nr:Fis family transcriptional regulator [Cyanobacteria bacterium UBA11049]